MEYLIISVVLLYFCTLPETTGSQHTLYILFLHVSPISSWMCTTDALSIYGNAVLSCTGSVVLNQTHPAAPYVCRTGNITLRCQYDGVEGVSTVVWLSGHQITTNPSTIPGHTALPRTTTYQEVVVDSYTNLATGYRCEPTFSNGSQLQSNIYIPQKECECCLLQHSSMFPTTSWADDAELNGQWSIVHVPLISSNSSLSFTDLFLVL